MQIQSQVHSLHPVVLRYCINFNTQLCCLNLVTGKKKFYFRGCGWSSKVISWSKDDELWIAAINQLFELMYGKDVQNYQFLKDKGTTVESISDPRLSFHYNHSMWEANYKSFLGSTTSAITTVRSLKPHLDQCCEKKPAGNLRDYNSMNTQSTDVPENNSVSGSIPVLKMEPSNSTSSPMMHSGTAPSRSTPVDLTAESTQSDIKSSHWLTAACALTRLELSKVDIPQMSLAVFQTVTKALGQSSFSDPLSLSERPPEGVVDKAVKAFRLKEGEQQATGVTISNLGTFSRDGITIFKKFCEISSLKAQIQSEKSWLESNPDGLSVADISTIKKVLWNQSGSATVLRAGCKSIDVSSFSTLVEERYLDNFIIDVSISWFLLEGQGKKTNICSKVLYLPSETHTWLNVNDKKFLKGKLQEVLFTSKEDEFEIILCPLHMNQMHWGIIVIDLLNRKLLFDDGYHLKPDSNVLPSIKHILDVFHELRPDANCFSSFFWSSITDFEHFGMPSQAICSQTGQGVGSCGVGVILSARDFVFKGATRAAHKFEWCYSEMRRLRKQLMLQIIKWGSKTS